MMLPDMSLLGWKVKDKISGYVGIVQGYTQYYGGVVQADVQSVGDGKTIPQAYFIDVGSLVAQGTKPVVTGAGVHQPLKANLGDEARDIVTGFKGIVTILTWYFNGCTKYTLSEKYRADAKDPLAVEFSMLEARVEVTKPVAKPVTKAKTGGPSVPSKRF